jgi:hypothetical protein
MTSHVKTEEVINQMKFNKFWCTNIHILTILVLTFQVFIVIVSSFLIEKELSEKYCKKGKILYYIYIF